MAAVVPSADQAVDLLKNLSLDSQSKTLEVTEPTKKTTVNSGNGQVQPNNNKAVTPLIPDYLDPSIGYYPNAYASNPYYYGGYDASIIDWEEYSKYLNAGADLSHGLYGYGYPPYAPYSPAGSPVPSVGQDGQSYGAQHYQYPNSYYQPLTPTAGTYPAGANSKVDTTTSEAADKSVLSVDTTKGASNGAKGNTGPAPVKPTAYQNSGYGSYGRGPHNSGYGFDAVHSPVPWLDSSMYSDPKTRNSGNNTPGSYGNSVASRNYMSQRPMTGLNTASGYMNGMYQNNLYGQYGSAYRSGYGYGSNAGWLTVDNKYKPRGRGNGFYGYNNENSDGLNELNRGPRARTIKNQKLFTPITIAVKGQNGTLPTAETIENEVKVVKEVKEVSVTPDREQYNKSDFPETFADAKFFIIKSYSEDDVHKSIKYNVWASTQNGNKKLDAAYKEAQQKSEPCPVFLFFSVNTSGQFVGVAEMVGPVDFDKSLEYWQQDKWIGCFPVKWHIIKDVANSLLKHIILEYNENKPVTNSRDTQEVKLEQGVQVVKIFKEHASKQCILDDFEFYEDRQKKIQEKKAKQQLFQKQSWEGKPAFDEKIKDGPKVEVQKSADDVDSVNVEKVADNVQDVGKDGLANGMALKKGIVNEVANGC